MAFVEKVLGGLKDFPAKPKFASMNPRSTQLHQEMEALSLLDETMALVQVLIVSSHRV